ncbi:MAG: hypothetical protein K0R54_1454, partial [Clostridiaceae bacterium]|nr:hypothetical protein [Clostridiaceae bacterium]
MLLCTLSFEERRNKGRIIYMNKFVFNFTALFQISVFLITL